MELRSDATVLEASDCGSTVRLMATPNALTRDQGTSRLGQGPSSATVLVEIERCSEPVPPVRAFVAPMMAAEATS
jgi:biotin/methionine sulfoxide reductase